MVAPPPRSPAGVPARRGRSSARLASVIPQSSFAHRRSSPRTSSDRCRLRSGRAGGVLSLQLVVEHIDELSRPIRRVAVGFRDFLDRETLAQRSQDMQHAPSPAGRESIPVDHRSRVVTHAESPSHAWFPSRAGKGRGRARSGSGQPPRRPLPEPVRGFPARVAPLLGATCRLNCPSKIHASSRSHSLFVSTARAKTPPSESTPLLPLKGESERFRPSPAANGGDSR